MTRSATAFGVTEIVLVGLRDFNAFGSHGSTAHLRFRHFPSLPQARLYLKEERNCDICGVEIVDGALPVTQQPFRKSTAFLGNEACLHLRSDFKLALYEIFMIMGVLV